LIFFALAAMPAATFKCKKSSHTTPDEYLQGKVIRISCASFIVQVLNNDTIGEDGWKDMMNNNAQYNNVFNASNTCKIPSGVKAGANIKFKVEKPTANDCVVCMMYDGPPNTKYDIKEMSIVEKQ